MRSFVSIQELLQVGPRHSLGRLLLWKPLQSKVTSCWLMCQGLSLAYQSYVHFHQLGFFSCLFSRQIFQRIPCQWNGGNPFDNPLKTNANLAFNAFFYFVVRAGYTKKNWNQGLHWPWMGYWMGFSPFIDNISFEIRSFTKTEADCMYSISLFTKSTLIFMQLARSLDC